MPRGGDAGSGRAWLLGGGFLVRDDGHGPAGTLRSPAAGVQDLLAVGLEDRFQERDAAAGPDRADAGGQLPSGTGRRMSMATRARRWCPAGSCCSMTQAASADGGPPCCASGLHGPAVAGCHECAVAGRLVEGSRLEGAGRLGRAGRLGKGSLHEA